MFNRNNIKNKKGVTLIELIVVIAILAILAAILIPSVTNYITEASISKNEASARSLYSEYTLNIATGTTYTAAATESLSDGTSCTVNFNTGFTAVTSVACGTGATAGTYTAP